MIPPLGVRKIVVPAYDDASQDLASWSCARRSRLWDAYNALSAAELMPM